mgnify:FL=1
MKKGKQTFLFKKGVYLKNGAAIVGEKEGRGPLKDYFDMILQDDKWGEDSFEKAERKMFKEALETAKLKAGLNNDTVDMIIGGDLLNQIISASFASKDFPMPFLGVYGACSTICESMLLGACLIEGGFADNILCATSSHFSSAERQYRFPLEYGSQRTPTSQWTVTGAGCSVISSEQAPIRLCSGTVGTIVDMGIKDANNMGAAMAPAAADTLCAFLKETGTQPNDYDLIVTGDLGKLGKEILIDLMQEKGYDVSKVINDCGCMMFYPEQDMVMGGSGCGCAATVFNGAIRKDMEAGKLHNVVLAATGAMLSPTSSFQGENIPGISYALNFRRC